MKLPEKIDMVLFVGIVATLLILAIPVINASVNCDIGWLAYAAKSAAQGKVLYKDLFEINPPLVFLPHFMANYIADVFNLDALKTFNALFLCAMLFAYVLTLKVARPLFENNSRKTLLVVGLFVYFMLLPLHGAFYGEREHLFSVLITPYILAIYLQIRYSKTVSCHKLIYAMALFGFILKPFYLFFFIAIELALLASKESTIIKRKSVYFTLVGLGLFYIAAALILTPHYFSDVMPIGINSYYGHRFTLDAIITKGLPNFIPTALIILLMAFCDDRVQTKSKILWLSILTASALLPIMQFKGWEYTYYPLFAFGFLIMLMLLLEADIKFERKKLSSVSIITYFLFSMAMLANVWEKLEAVNPSNVYLKPILLYTIVFLPVMMFKHKSFKTPLSVLLMAISLVFISLVLYSETIYLLINIGSEIMWGTVLAIMICGIYSGRKFELNDRTKSYFLPIILIAILAFYAKQLESNYYSLRHKPSDDLIYARLENIINVEAPNKSIFIFNTNMYPAFPLVNYTNASWGTRFHHLWMLPAIYENATPENRCFVENKFLPERDFVYGAIFADLKKSKPDLIIFDESPQKFIWQDHPVYNWRECIAGANAELNKWIDANYEHISTIYQCSGSRRWSCKYDVYKLKGLITAGS